MKRFVAALAACLIPMLLGTALAVTTVYVNNTASCPGSGTSAAPYCSIANAFTHAAAGQDIRIQNTGTSYNESDVLSVSGTASNPIVIESDNHASPPTITDTVNTADYSTQLTISASYVTVQNLIWDGLGANVAEHGIYVDAAAHAQYTGDIIQNNIFRNWGSANTTINYNGYSNSAVFMQGGGGAGGTDVINGVVQNNTFSGNRARDIEMNGCENCKILNNTMTGLQCGLQNGASGLSLASVGAESIHIFYGANQFASNTLVQGNNIGNFATTCPSNLSSLSPSYRQWSGIHFDGGDMGALVQDNVVHDISTVIAPNTDICDGIQFEFGTANDTAQNNLVYNMGTTGAFSGCKGIVNTPNQTSSIATNNNIIGNTVYNVAYVCIQIASRGTIEDNAIEKCGNDIGWWFSTCPSCVIDYNIYADANSFSINGGNPMSFASWKTATGGDAHSLNSNPNLSNPSAGTVAGFEETASSPTLGAGTTISKMTTDFLGITRTVPYDIGAFQGVLPSLLSSPRPSPPRLSPLPSP